jgi:hypothetical protein
MNMPRLATRNRRHWRTGAELIQRVCEDGRINGHELNDIQEWLHGGLALGSVIDINDARGRATSTPQVVALNQEFDAWIEQLPE